MKHVVTAAPLRQRLLVTGFGAFPGAPRNPTALILRHLERDRGRLERLGIDMRCVLIPVLYADVAPTLRQAVSQLRPDAILHLGLASRSRGVSVETRAVNRAGPLHPDAAGRVPSSQIIARDAPQWLAATYAASPILAAIRRERVPAHLSIDAGDYVCNATLYRSLLDAAAPQVGFLHVPSLRNRVQPKARTTRRTTAPKPTVEILSRAVLAAVFVMIRHARTRAAAAIAPTAPRTGDGPETR